MQPALTQQPKQVQYELSDTLSVTVPIHSNYDHEIITVLCRTVSHCSHNGLPLEFRNVTSYPRQYHHVQQYISICVISIAESAKLMSSQSKMETLEYIIKHFFTKFYMSCYGKTKQQQMQYRTTRYSINLSQETLYHD